MIVTNTETIPGKKIVKILGVVKGNTVRARFFGRDILAGIKGLVGGEVVQYTEMMSQARDEAFARMVKEAEQLGADAVVNIRFMTADVMQGMAEILAYGTAVKLEDDVE